MREMRPRSVNLKLLAVIMHIFINLMDEWQHTPESRCASCVFAHKPAKKLSKKVGKVKAEIEPVSTGVVESVVLVIKNGEIKFGIRLKQRATWIIVYHLSKFGPDQFLG